MSHRWQTSAAQAVQGLGRPVGVPGRTSDPHPVSMAMHLHASFSEKTASFEAHLAEARRIGVDVLWWTDHDFRVNAFGYRDAVGFDGFSEPGPDPALGWEWTEEREGPLSLVATEFVDEPHAPDERGRAMRLTARGDSAEPGTLWYHAQAGNLRYSTSLADTTLELDVWPESVTSTSFLIIEIQSSYHPAAPGRPAGRYRLRYHVGDFPRTQRRLEEDDLLGVIDVPAGRGGRNRLQLRPVDDIAQLWPDLVAGDNSLVHLRLGLRSVDGQVAQVVVDRLRFLRAEREGRGGLDLRRRILDVYADRFPDLRQYEALEVSLTRHLNWFGGDLAQPDYTGLSLTRDDDVDLVSSAVEMIHDHGALASWNHPLGLMYGPETKEELAAIMLATNALGSDVVEIGNNPDIDDMLWVWDVAAANGVIFTGNGVSDDHTAENWIDQKNSYLTHVWSPTVELPDVLGALRSGRSWFASATWRGSLDLELGGQPAMGGVLADADRPTPLVVNASDLPADSTLEIISGVVGRTGSDKMSPDLTSRTVPAAAMPHGGFALDLDPGPTGSFARAQIRDRDGTVFAASNPVWALPEGSPIHAPTDRLITLT